jgi:hypothetical protein
VADPVDRALRDLDESWDEEAKAPPAAEDGSVNDRTILGVGTPRPVPVVAAPSATPAAAAASPAYLQQPRARRPTPEPESKLAHPEQSPLAFVMRASESPGPQKQESHDMSMFVAGLVADTSPVVEAAPAGTAMEPVMRPGRKRRQWIVASAIAGTAIVGVLVGMHFAASEDPPRIAASETMPADVAPQPVAELPAAPDNSGPPADDVPPPPSDVAAQPVVAIPETTATPRAATKPSTNTGAKKAAPKKVATASTTAKKSSKKPATKKSVVAKKTTAKKLTTTAKKLTPAKKTIRTSTKKSRR